MKSRLARVNQAEEAFLFQWRMLDPNRHFEPQRNHRFHPTRRWEIDFAWPAAKVGIEIQGGIWIGGAHARPSNIERDMEKHNALLDLGWRVWHFSPRQVKSGEAVQHLERVLLCARKGETWPTVATAATPSLSGRSGELPRGRSSSDAPF